MALIGYARVSTAEQDTALQTDTLRKAGCEHVFEGTASGAKADRPGLADALAYRVCHGKPKALALITSTSPVAWRHLLLGGHYTFADGGKMIDLDALLDGLDME